MCGGKVDAIWDVNALVAMPMDNWNRYILCTAGLTMLSPPDAVILTHVCPY